MEDLSNVIPAKGVNATPPPNLYSGSNCVIIPKPDHIYSFDIQRHVKDTVVH